MKIVFLCSVFKQTYSWLRIIHSPWTHVSSGLDIQAFCFTWDGCGARQTDQSNRQRTEHHLPSVLTVHVFLTGNTVGLIVNVGVWQEHQTKDWSVRWIHILDCFRVNTVPVKFYKRKKKSRPCVCISYATVKQFYFLRNSVKPWVGHGRPWLCIHFRAVIKSVCCWLAFLQSRIVSHVKKKGIKCYLKSRVRETEGGWTSALLAPMLWPRFTADSERIVEIHRTFWSSHSWVVIPIWFTQHFLPHPQTFSIHQDSFTALGFWMLQNKSGIGRKRRENSIF